MKHFKLSALFLTAALSIAAVASAALSGITLDRNVSAGQVLVDTDANAAVQFTNTSGYADLVKTGTDGKVTLNLNAAISSNSNSGFNADAAFTIGSPDNGVIRIKNNSDVPITVSMSDSTNNSAIAISPANQSSSTISAGNSGDFYFTVNTSGRNALDSLKAVLHVAAE